MLVYGTWTAHSPTHSLSLPLTHSLIHLLTHSLIHTPSLLYFLFPSCFSMLSPSLKKLVTCGVIRSFNLHWGKSFDFMAPADSVRRLEMQNFGLPQFCASFGVFSCGVCRSRAESVHLLKPYLQWGKGWKSSNFVTPDDSARNCKMRKMMSLNSSICLMPIFGVGKAYRIWTPKGGPPQFSTWMFVSSFLPFVVSWFLANFWSSWVRSEHHVATPKQDCHTLQRVDLARPFLVLPAIKIEIENSPEMALSKAKSGSA